MVTNLITAQVIRYVTDRVMENMTRQAGRVLPGASNGAADVASLAVVAQVGQQFERMSGRIDDLESRLEKLSIRLSASEKKIGWSYTARLILGVVVGIAVGVGATVLARLAGLIG